MIKSHIHCTTNMRVCACVWIHAHTIIITTHIHIYISCAKVMHTNNIFHNNLTSVNNHLNCVRCRGDGMVTTFFSTQIYLALFVRPLEIDMFEIVCNYFGDRAKHMPHVIHKCYAIETLVQLQLAWIENAR